MRWYDLVDNENRYVGFKVSSEQSDGKVYISHIYTYLKARELMQEAGITMGLELTIQEIQEE
jgi:hypothetical protein